MRSAETLAVADMGKSSSNPVLPYEEVQRIIDERLSEIIRREDAESLRDDASSAPDKERTCIFFRRHDR